MHRALSVIVADDDLLFSTRITASLTNLGHRPLPVDGLGAFRDALNGAPDAAILNLAAFKLDALEAIRLAKGDPRTQAVPLLGFCGHADAPRREAARKAGCDLLATNGEVSGSLPRLLERLLNTARSSAPGL
jgi:CheY-like chemotaxis protein